MNTQEDKIEETLNSLSGMKRAEANPFLYDKVMHRMAQAGTQPSRPFFSLQWQLAGLFLLLALNAYTFFSYRTSASSEAPIQTFATEYFARNNNYNY